MAVPLVSRLAETLGLPGNTPEAVDAGRDKYATRECLAKAGLPTPRNSRIRAPGDVEPAGTYVGFPSVIKPVSGAGLSLRHVLAVTCSSQMQRQSSAAAACNVYNAAALCDRCCGAKFRQQQYAEL